MRSNLSEADIALLSKDLFESICEVLDDGAELRAIDYTEHKALHALWYASERVGTEFVKRREAFIWILERLLREGRIKLQKKGVFLESSIEAQVQAFRDAWPESIAASGYEDFYWWFFDDACPAGVAWRLPDGNYQIAD